jgi:hypothetical protein
VRNSIIENMKPKASVLRQLIAKAIDFLEKAKATLNGHVPDADVAIDDALERLYGWGENSGMTDPYRNPASQKERAAILKNDQRNNTLAGRTASEIELEAKGRFGATKPQVIGEAAQYPKGADWCGQDRAQEPPFGVDINAVPICGEPHEQANAIGVDGVTGGTSDPNAEVQRGPVQPPIIRRPIRSRR